MYMSIDNVGSRIMNTYIYPIANGYVLVDTGYARSFDSVAQRLGECDIVWSDIQYVFLTHAHDDHAGFLNELLAKQPQIKVFISDQAMPTLLRGQNAFNGGCSGLLAFVFCKLMGLFGKGQHRFPPIDKRYMDRFIEITPESKALAEEILEGKVLFTPGHTADSLSLRVGGVIFCGDATMNGLPSRKRITIWIEDKAAFERSWELLINEKASLILPAHGKPFEDHELIKYKSSIRKVKLYKLQP